jgi:hypothetical protein
MSNKSSWGRVALALAAVLVVAGPSLVLAGSPNSSYVPKSSVLLGPKDVKAGTTAQYTLRVTFTNSVVCDFPPTTGATFTSANGTITSSGLFTAGTVGRARVSGSFSQNSVTTTSSRIINVVP